MIKKFLGMNISSKDPKRLALFYRDVLGLTMLNEGSNYDGATFGNDNDEPVFWIWDENKWGKANEGPVCFVFNCYGKVIDIKTNGQGWITCLRK